MTKPFLPFEEMMQAAEQMAKVIKLDKDKET